MGIQRRSDLRLACLILCCLFCATACAQPVKAGRRGKNSKNYYLLRDAEYANTDGESLKLDLYRPRIIAGRLPVIIQIHGGAFTGGDKAPCPFVEPLVKNGFAVASLNYRLGSKGTFPNAVYDVKSAVRWLMAHADAYHLDSERFGAIGASAGGYLVAMLGVTGDTKDFDKGSDPGYPSSVRAVVDLYGISDFSTLAQERIDRGETSAESVQAQAAFLGCENYSNCPALARASPINYVSGDTPPFLMLHCAGDRVVPAKQSERLYKALKDKGREAELIVIPRDCHAAKLSAEQEKKIILFFNKYLRSPSSRSSQQTL